MDRALSQLIDQPRVDRAQAEISSTLQLAEFLRIFRIVEHPAPFARGQEGIEWKARLTLNEIAMRRELSADRGRAPALPTDGVAQRLSCFAMPGDRRFSLV